VVFRQCSIKGMRLGETSCEDVIMSSVSLIGTCVKRDSTSKLTNMSVGCNRIFWIFCMKSIELIICVLDFPMRHCSSFARKRERSYVGEFRALTIGLRGMLALCIFGRPYNLGGRGFLGFNVVLIMLEMLLFSIRILVSCAIVAVGSLLSLVYVLFTSRVTTVVLPLSAGSMIISVSLLRSCRASRSCLVMFDGGGLALRRMLATCVRMLSACSEGSL